MYLAEESGVNLALSSADQSGVALESKESAADTRRLAAIVIFTAVFLGFVATAMAVAVFTLSSDSDTTDEIPKSAEPPAKSQRDLGDAGDLTAIIPEFRTQVVQVITRRRTTTRAPTAAASTQTQPATTSTTLATTTKPTTTSTTTTTPATTTSTTSTTSTTTTTTAMSTRTTSTTKLTTAPTTTSTETPAVETTPSIPTPTTEEPKKDTWVGLLCTAGTKLTDLKRLPQDKVCNYLFYDSVYKKGATPFDPKNLDPALSIFLDGGKKLPTTMLGIGFAYKYRKHLKSQLKTKGGAVPGVVKYFFDQGICNFGILDTPASGVEKKSFKQMLESLNLLRQFSKNHNTSRAGKCRTVLVGPSAGKNLDNIYIETFSSIFTPDIVVLLSHYVEGDNTFKDCRVVPPTILSRPVTLSTNSSYKHDMHRAADEIRKLTKGGLVASWALSLTMKGRWTVLKEGEPADFLSKCVHDPKAGSFGSYAEVCENPDFSSDLNYTTGIHGSAFHRQSDGKMFSYDTPSTLVEKLCRVRVSQLSFAFGIVAFDVDYDDFANVCTKLNRYGAFSRLYYMQDLLVYFENIFDVSGELKDCLKLAA